MAAAVAASPTSGTHLETAFEVSCTGVDANTATGYDTTKYPASPAVVYYFSFEKSGQDSLVSPRFTPAEDGKAEWHSVILGAAGTWTLYVRADADDSEVASVSVTVA